MDKEILGTSLNSGMMLMDQVTLSTLELNGNLFTTDEGNIGNLLT